MDYRRYSVSLRDKKPLLDFVLHSLSESGCKILNCSPANEAPFRITFEDPSGIRSGVIVYAFYANSKTTKNRPSDEHRFQVKYGSKDGKLHQIWQDPFGLYTTLMVGIDTSRGLFVGVDPLIHENTRFFISIEFKAAHVEEALRTGWHYWEREKRSGEDTPTEVMVAGTRDRILDFIRFEQAALGLSQGHRLLLAENLDRFMGRKEIGSPDPKPQTMASPNTSEIHSLAKEFQIPSHEILNLIEAAPRLKMAVRGWVAERHLNETLVNTEGVDSCKQLEADGMPDFEVVYQGSKPILIECKNVLRTTLADGTVRVDFQKTRASKNDPCSRFYRPSEFQILAACLHPRLEEWVFSYQLTHNLEEHKKCPGHLSNLVRLDSSWTNEASKILASASAS